MAIRARQVRPQSRRAGAGYMFIAPFMIVFAAMFIAPLAYAAAAVSFLLGFIILIATYIVLIMGRVRRRST